MYVAEDGNRRVSVFTTNGTFIQHIGQRGKDREGEFDHPYAVVIDALGNLYVGDFRNNVIKVF